MKQHNMVVPENKLFIRIPDAKFLIKQKMTKLLDKQKKELVWFDFYDDVVSWLENNDGRSLFLHGKSGLGKTLLCEYVIPEIFLEKCKKVIHAYDAVELNEKADEILTHKLLCIDDIGIESESIKFGQRRMIFPELMDKVEKQGKLILLTTNLTVDELLIKYGERTMDRIRATTKRIAFDGKSLRS